MNKRGHTYIIGLVLIELILGGLLFLAGIKYIDNLKSSNKIEQMRMAEDLSAVADAVNGLQGNLIFSAGLPTIRHENFKTKIKDGIVNINQQYSIYGKNPSLREESAETTGTVWFSKIGDHVEIGPVEFAEKRKNYLKCDDKKPENIGIDAADEKSRSITNALKSLIPEARTGTENLLKDPVESIEQRKERLTGTFVVSISSAEDSQFLILIPNPEQYDYACTIANSVIDSGLYEDAAILPSREESLKIVGDDGIVIKARTGKFIELAEAIRNGIS